MHTFIAASAAFSISTKSRPVRYLSLGGVLLIPVRLPLSLRALPSLVYMYVSCSLTVVSLHAFPVRQTGTRDFGLVLV